MITDKTSLTELAGIVSDALEQQGIVRRREERSDVAISDRHRLCQSVRDCHALRARNDSEVATSFRSSR